VQGASVPVRDLIVRQELRGQSDRVFKGRSKHQAADQIREQVGIADVLDARRRSRPLLVPEVPHPPELVGLLRASVRHRDEVMPQQLENLPLFPPALVCIAIIMTACAAAAQHRQSAPL